MVIDMFSDGPSLNASPRISFSHNLHQTDNVQIENYPFCSDASLSDSNSDFDFNITSFGIRNESSSADELFSDGLIRPLQLQQRFITSKNENPNREISKQLVFMSTTITSTTGVDHSEQKIQSKSFWRIKRSSSLHCESTNKKNSFWSLPLLSRSNSTGSVPKDTNNNHNPKQKQAKNSIMAGGYVSLSQQKPPLKRNYGGAYDYGVRISPVLNVPPPFISKGAANLLGLGSFFRNGRDKKNKK